MSTVIAALKSFEQHLDDSPFTKTQRKVWILSAMGVLLDGFDFFIIGVALPLIAHDFHMNAATKGLVAVAAVAGAFFGALVFGQVADRMGRKGMFLVDIILFVVFSAASASAWNPASLIVFRFLLGIGIGADYPIGVSYIAECVPTRLRGRLIVGAFAFQALGSLLGVLVGLAILKLDPSLTAWRWMLAFGVMPAVAVVLMREGLPESVRWHLARGNYEKASRAASQLLEAKVTLTAQNSPPPERGMSFGSLFKKRYIRRTIFASVPWFLQDISTYGIGIFTPTIMAAMALGGGASFIAKDMGATEGAAAVDLLLIVGFMLAIVLVHHVSRVTLQIGGFLGMALGLLMVAASSLMPMASDRYMGMIFGGFMVFNTFMNMGPNATTYLLSGETFPTSIRATGAGFAASMAKLGAVVGTFFFPVLKAEIGIPALLISLAVASALAAAVTYGFRVDTRASLDAQQAEHLVPAKQYAEAAAG
ncbi:MAG: MFS transporter [Candidatus Korobacteraceae bacterium]